MGGIFSVADAKKKIEQLNFPALVKYYLKEHKQTLRFLSLAMGEDHNYIYRQLKSKRPDPALIYALSIHLTTNLFEPFLNLLPENISPTTKEKQLQQQVTDLQRQLSDVTRERDLLERIATRA